MWVIKEQFDRGFEKELLAAVKSWIAKEWPFKNVDFPSKNAAP
jgi:hypothetical protein